MSDTPDTPCTKERKISRVIGKAEAAERYGEKPNIRALCRDEGAEKLY